MVVFYSISDAYGHRRIDAIGWLSEVILPVDISYWAVPGTLED